MNDKRIQDVVDEAARILRDYPELRYSEAIKRAKNILGYEKEPITDQGK